MKLRTGDRAGALVLVLISAATFLTAGCKKPNPMEEALKAVTIFPTKVGNRWTYATTFFDSTGRQLPWSVHDVVMEVSGEVSVGRELWYIVGPRLLCNTPDALWRLDENTRKIVYKYPAHEGYSYRTDGVKVAVAAIDAQVAVLGGSLLCYRYEYCRVGSDFTHEIHYCAPLVGLVRVEVFDITSNNIPYLLMTLDLKEVQLL